MLHAKSISFVLFFVFLFASPLFANPSDIVVKIQAVRNPPSYHQPWQNLGHRSVNGSGIIVDGGRILTNAHVVANSVFIHVQKAGKTEKYPAEVEFFGHASDLALLRVDDADFFKGIKTLPFGQLPQVRDKVAVYGFPDGGDKLSITEGVVSRIEHISYAYSGAYLLACQISKEIVILAEVLADKVNVGYHELGDNVVRQVDGVPANNFEHFIALVETATSEYVEIIVNRGTKLVVDRDVFASTKRILDKFAIGSARDQH